MHANKVEDRLPYLSFTEVYDHHPQAVIAQEDHPSIETLNDLCGSRIGVLHKSSQSTVLSKRYPCIKLVHFNTTKEVAFALAKGEIDAMFGNYDYSVTTLKRAGLSGFKTIHLEYIPPIGFARIGVKKTEPLLVSIFNKAIAAITEEEKARISSKWIDIELPPVPQWLKSESQVTLTPDERTWLDAHSIIRMEGGILQPLDGIERDGEVSGLARAYSDLIAAKLGIRFEHSTGVWAEVHERAKRKEIDAIRLLVPNRKREAYLNFSEPYAEVSFGLVTREGTGAPIHLSDLGGRRVAVLKASYPHNYLAQNYPAIKLVEVDYPKLLPYTGMRLLFRNSKPLPVNESEWWQTIRPRRPSKNSTPKRNWF